MKTIKIKSDGKILIEFVGHELTLEVVNDGKMVHIEPLYPSGKKGETTTLPMKVHKTFIRGQNILVTGVEIRLNKEIKCEPPPQEDTKSSNTGDATETMEKKK